MTETYGRQKRNNGKKTQDKIVTNKMAHINSTLSVLTKVMMTEKHKVRKKVSEWIKTKKSKYAMYKKSFSAILL